MAVRLRKREFEITRTFVDVKYFSKRNVEKKAKSYTSSINLPRTLLPLRHDSAKRVDADIHIQKVCGFSSLYEWQRKHSTGSEFILHDGPPYANGSPHMGHAINKILKDIIIRHKLLLGHKINYVPGWDCHGLPIELKALSDAHDLSPVEIRHKARQFAEGAVEAQRAVFRSWGVMADWDHGGCYYTSDKRYVGRQLRLFGQLHAKGLIFRDFKPVFWSPSSKTALAESELEYEPSHSSVAVTLRLRVASVLDHVACEGDRLYAAVWTTTPWTLPANQAVCFNPALEYSLVRPRGTQDRYIVASERVADFAGRLGTQDVETISSFPGTCLANAKYFHPLTGRRMPMLPADHVTTDKGTGLVHTAPAHGPEDFLVALRNKMSVASIVDREGRFTGEAGPRLQGLAVLDEGNKTVLEMLGSDVLHSETYVHSYPYDWRTKKPVILRASRQWFFDTGAIKQKAVDALSDVEFVPPRGPNASTLIGQLQRRPYWCISRQRAWGVPIPVLYHRGSGKPLVSEGAMSHYCHLLDKHGTDFWWTLPMEALAPDCLLAEHKVTSEQLTRGQDILDIWLDSGLSWACVVGGAKRADLYLEGVDQFTGWFQSSLMTSVALRGHAPFRAVFSHGFAVDGSGRKMSKSEGNVVDPCHVIGGREGGGWPAHGVDALRWWVASHATQHATVSVSQPLIKSSADAVHKLRIVLRFLLGSLHDHTPLSPAPSTCYRHLDRYLLHLLYLLDRDVRAAYQAHTLNRACSLVLNFVTNEVSALYCHLVKDRLYCEEAGAGARRACQAVVAQLLEGLLCAVGPVLPHLAEEVHLYHPHKKGETLFRSEGFRPREDWNQPDLARTVELALEVKKAVNRSSSVTNTLELDAVVTAGGETWQALKRLDKGTQDERVSELPEILQVSSVCLVHDPALDGFRVETGRSSAHLCDRCRRFTADNSSEPCSRCLRVLGSSAE